MPNFFDGEFHMVEMPAQTERVVGFKPTSGYSEDLVGPWEEPSQVALVEPVKKASWEHSEFHAQERTWSNFIIIMKEIAKQLGGNIQALQKVFFDDKKKLIVGGSFELQFHHEDSHVDGGRL